MLDESAYLPLSEALSISLALLHQTGVEADWMTVYVGWRGFRTGYDERWCRLSSSEVRDYARDQLGVSGDSDAEYRTLRVADGDFEPFLRNLARATGLTFEDGLRRWRYAQVARVLSLVPDPTDEEQCAHVAERLDLLPSVWEDVVSVNPFPDLAFDDRPEALRRHRATLEEWREWERRELLAESPRR